MRTTQRRGWNQAKVVATKPVRSICSRDKVTWCCCITRGPESLNPVISLHTMHLCVDKCFTDLTLAPSFRGLCSQCLLPLLDQWPPKTHSGDKKLKLEKPCKHISNICFYQVRPTCVLSAKVYHQPDPTSERQGTTCAHWEVIGVGTCNPNTEGRGSPAVHSESVVALKLGNYRC